MDSQTPLQWTAATYCSETIELGENAVIPEYEKQ